MNTSRRFVAQQLALGPEWLCPCHRKVIGGRRSWAGSWFLAMTLTINAVKENSECSNVRYVREPDSWMNHCIKPNQVWYKLQYFISYQVIQLSLCPTPFFHVHSSGPTTSVEALVQNQQTLLLHTMGDREHRQDVHVYVLDTPPDTLADDGAISDGWEVVDSSPTVAHDHDHDPHAAHGGVGDRGETGDEEDEFFAMLARESERLDRQGSDSEPPQEPLPFRTTSAFVTRLKPMKRKAPWDHMFLSRQLALHVCYCLFMYWFKVRNAAPHFSSRVYICLVTSIIYRTLKFWVFSQSQSHS